MDSLILFLALAAVVLLFSLVVAFVLTRARRQRRGSRPGDVTSGGFFDWFIGDSGSSGSHSHHHSGDATGGHHHGGGFDGGGHHGGGFDGGGFGGGHH